MGYVELELEAEFASEKMTMSNTASFTDHSLERNKVG
jgi:hypothetical protein